MALEQLLAYLDDRPQEELGPTVVVGPDRFHMLEFSELREQHEVISGLLGDVLEAEIDYGQAPDPGWCKGDQEHRTLCYLALLERAFGYEVGLREQPQEFSKLDRFFGYGSDTAALAQVLEAGVDQDRVLIPTLRWILAHRSAYYASALIGNLLTIIEEEFEADLGPVQSYLVSMRSQMLDSGYGDWTAPLKRIEALLGDGLWQTVIPGEVWTDKMTADLEGFAESRRNAWLELLQHCHGAKSAKPTAKWKKTGASLVEAVTESDFCTRVEDWFGLIDKGRTQPVLNSVWDNVDGRQRFHDVSANMARGLLWLAIPLANGDLCRTFARVALSTYRKVRGIGPRAPKVGNAAVYALGEVGTLDAVGQLAVLKVRVKFGTAQKGIERSLVKAAETVGVPRDELEEMSVPAYGLTEVGQREELLGDFTAEVEVDRPKCKILWRKSDGKLQKSVPASVKKDWADDLKELKQSVKDIERMLPAQSARIEQLFLQQKEWEFSVWRERYLDHPLVGVLARRLIWTFQVGKQSASGIWHEGRLIDQHGEEVRSLGEGTRVSLWHPLSVGVDAAEISAWRAWLVDHEVRQPFKQAHREIYLITDAERTTSVYSNRFAAHVLKQHQYNALCGARGWKNQLRMAVDDNYDATHINLPTWDIRAEYWVEGIGEDYGTDTTEAGAYFYLATDQVRFYRSEAAPNYAHAAGGGFHSAGTDRQENQPIVLDEVPALVFSEVMRDVDLFVGVASVGNDPNWSDGGPEGRFQDYWNTYSFGHLGETASTRKVVLESLVPRLKIADRCSFSDRFLVVRGDVRTYKIHLGSGNILMEPNDQYLCIVPGRSALTKGDKVFLPFEGDNMLSVILSKAFLLAEDKKIKDSTILSQIRP